MDNIANIDNMDFYQILREKIRNWHQSPDGHKGAFADFILFAPDFFHLICKLIADQEVSINDKANLGLVLVYFISPIDFLPEAIAGPLGYTDDIALCVLALNKMINHTDPEILRKHWAGNGDVIDLMKHISDVIDKMLDKTITNNLKKLIN
jgi:uncharacterized membrane protein YkvA (DUF1232 family)